MPIPLIVWGVIAIGTALGLSGCPVARKREEEDKTRDRCGECHLSPAHSKDGWKGLMGQDCYVSGRIPPDRGCGSHDIHLQGASRLTSVILCKECHHIPASVWGDPKHVDTETPRSSEVTFPEGGRSAQRNIPSSYESADQTCLTACHGAGLAGGAERSMPWTAVPQQEQGCTNLCHGLPPPSPHFQHLQTKDCYYCHTETMAADGTFADTRKHIDGKVETVANICIACHGQPPSAPQDPQHPARHDCSSCHPTMSRDANGNQVMTDPDHHNDGQGVKLVPPPQICSRCHGNDQTGNPAPPSDTQGNTDPSSRGVGAHQTHLDTNNLVSSNVVCESCHRKYHTIFDSGHRDGAKTVVFNGGMGTANSVAASYDPQLQSCAVYCHGVNLNAGGNLTNPVWTDTTGTPKHCDACHGKPPPLPHIQSGHCERCHDETAGSNLTIADQTKHVDGHVQVNRAKVCLACHGQPPSAPHPNRHDCSSCHPTVGPADSDGNPVIVDPAHHNDGQGGKLIPPPQICSKCHGNDQTGDPAPPLDTDGNTDSSAVGVHQSHLHSSISSNVVCKSCHPEYQTVFDPGHRDGAKTVVFNGGMGTANGVAAAYDPQLQSCAVYCHGVSLNAGGNLTQPIWTDTTGAPKQCDACHGLPPQNTHMSSWTNCSFCHPTAERQSDGTLKIVRPDLHINGVVDSK